VRNCPEPGEGRRYEVLKRKRPNNNKDAKGVVVRNCPEPGEGRRYEVLKRKQPNNNKDAKGVVVRNCPEPGEGRRYEVLKRKRPTYLNDTSATAEGIADLFDQLLNLRLFYDLLLLRQHIFQNLHGCQWVGEYSSKHNHRVPPMFDRIQFGSRYK